MFVSSDGWTCYTPEEKQAILDSTGEYYDAVVALDDQEIIARRREILQGEDDETLKNLRRLYNGVAA